MQHLSNARYLTAHGALMDPAYLRDAIRPGTGDKAQAVVRIALLAVFAVPFMAYLAGMA